MKASDVKGLPVRPSGSGKTAGGVGDLILDVDEQRVVALLVMPSEGETQYALATDDVVSVDAGAVVSRQDAVIQPLADTPRLIPLPTFNRLVNEDAVTETGQCLGKVVDVSISPRWEITEYNVVENFADAFGRGSTGIPARNVHTGARMIMVTGLERNAG